MNMKVMYLANDSFDEKRVCLFKSETNGQAKLLIHKGTDQECRTIAAAFVMLGYSVIVEY